MLIGYARVSTHDQNIDLQKDALLAAGCEKIFVDELSAPKLPVQDCNRQWIPSERGTSWWSGDWTVWAGPSGTCSSWWLS